MYKKYSLFAFLVIFSTTLKAQVTEAALVKQVMETIGYNYYDTAYGQVENWDALKHEYIQAALKGQAVDSIIDNIFTTIGDPALRILEPKEFATYFDEVMARSHVGVGLAEMTSLDIDRKTGNLTVITPIYGTPAFDAGLRSGDEILDINGQNTQELTLEDAMKLLRVKEGEKVSLLVGRNQKLIPMSLKAKQLEPITSPLYKIITYKHKKIGIIWIPQFTENISLHFLSVLQKFKKAEVDGIILDIRHNPGGIITEAQSIAGFFIGQKPMAFTQSKNSAIKMLASNSKQVFEKPLTVLVNEGTASAAEALAGILQYYKRANIIGAETNGKGLIYGFYEVGNQSTIVIPVGRLIMLDQKDIDLQGILPDDYFHSKKTFRLNKSYKRDPMLKYSVEQLFKVF